MLINCGPLEKQRHLEMRQKETERKERNGDRDGDRERKTERGREKDAMRNWLPDYIG